MASMTFGGTSLFPAPSTANFQYGEAPQARKDDGFPGVAGVIRTNLGQRARAIIQTGLLIASNHSNYASRVTTIRGYETSGEEAALVDEHGESNSNVVMDYFLPGTKRTATDGSVLSRYEIRWVQLVP